MALNETFESDVLTTENDNRTLETLDWNVQDEAKYVNTYSQMARIEGLFPEVAHQWEEAMSGYTRVYEDEKGMLAVSRTRENGEIIIAGAYKIGESYSPYTLTFDFKERDSALIFQEGIVNAFSYSEESRYEILHDLLKESNQDILEQMSPSELDIFLSELLVENLSELNSEIPNNEAFRDIMDVKSEIPDSYQQLFKEFSKRLDPEEIEEFCKTISSDVVYFPNKPFEEKNIYGTYSYLRSSFEYARKKHENTSDVTRVTTSHERFPIEEQIQATFDSEEELSEKLKNIPYKNYQKENYQSFIAPPTVKMVKVQEIVGTTRTDTKSWEGNTAAAGRGTSLIFKMAKSIENGTFDLHKHSVDLFRLIKDGDEYYLLAGNHRMGAIKAMGIENIPCVVQEVTTN